MYRREFLKYAVTAGFTVTLFQSGWADMLPASPQDGKKLPFVGLTPIDAHSHPYCLHQYPHSVLSRLKNSGQTSTIHKMKEAGLSASVFAVVGDRREQAGSVTGLFEDTMNQFKVVEQLIDRNRITLLINASDFEFKSADDKPTGAILAVEGGDALEGKLINLDSFYDYGVRILTVMHKHDNDIGFNQESLSAGPLTSFGCRLVEKMNELGMIIDVAHSNTKTLKSISEISQLPLLDSHTAPFPDGEENSFPNRARTWDEMELIAKSGGLICSMPIGYTLGNYSRTTIKDWAVEIRLMKERLGIEHIGFGSDSAGLPRYVDGWESIASLPDLLNELVSLGFTKDELFAFTGGNFIRIAQKCLH